MTIQATISTPESNPLPMLVAAPMRAFNLHGGDGEGPIAVWAGGPSIVAAETLCFDFSMALALLRLGRRVARTGWNGKGMFLFLVPGSTFQVNRPPLLGIYPAGEQIEYQPHIDMRTAQGTIVPWLASQTDLIACDWVLIPDTEAQAMTGT